MADDWDPYVILGVPAAATADEIRSAYRHLARMYHPDANPRDESAARRFRMVVRAYESLSGSADERAPVAAAAPARAGAPRGAAVGAADPSSSFSSSSSSSSSSSPSPSPSSSSSSSPSSSSSSSSSAVYDDDDDDWYGPGDEPGSMPIPDGASAAAASTLVAPPSRPRLRVVRADVTLAQVIRPGATYLEVPGVGRVAVKIPAGADTGTIVPAIVRKSGDVDRLAVELRLLPDPKFRRRGLDLVTRYPLSAKLAWRGLSTTIDTPWGPVALTIPARSRWGDVVRIPCKGIMGGSDGWGNLFVEVAEH